MNGNIAYRVMHVCIIYVCMYVCTNQDKLRDPANGSNEKRKITKSKFGDTMLGSRW